MTDFDSWLLGSANQPVPLLRVRVQALLTVLLMATNVIGALIVFGLTLVIPGPLPSPITLLVVAVAAPGYVAFGLVLGGWWGTRRALRSLHWALAGRSPSPAERSRALRVPRELTVVQGVLWAGATVMFAVLLGFLQPGLVLVVSPTVGFAGIVVCAHAYLLGEFALRPVAARALADGWAPRRRLGGVGTRMLLFWCLGTGVPVAGLITFALLVLLRGGVTPGRLAITVVVLGGIVLVFGLLVTVFTAKAIVEPLGSVRKAMDRVGRGEWDVAVTVYDGTDLGLLQAGFNRMAGGLRERERIRDLFGRHVGHEVAAAALRQNVALGGAVQEVSVLFVDLVGSTELAANRPPTEVVALLNRFFALVVDEIDARGGLVNKFVGDAVLAVFGAPVTTPDHATHALSAARAIARRLPAELPEAVAGIGVATGQVVAGNVGDRRRFEYTVIGDPVNEAARLTELAKKTPGCLLASGAALARAEPHEAMHWTESHRVILRGRSQSTVVAVPAN